MDRQRLGTLVETFRRDTSVVGGTGVLRSKLREIGRGGTHVVFRPRSLRQCDDQIVFKVPKVYLDGDVRESRDRVEHAVLGYARMNQVLSECFGGATPCELVVPQPFIDDLGVVNAKCRIVPGIFQEWLAAFSDSRRIAIQADYIELRNRDPSVVAMRRVLNNWLLRGGEVRTGPLMALCPGITQCLSMIAVDAEFANCVILLLKSLKKYVETTRHIVDFAGTDNVVVVKTNGDWQYIIGTVAKGDSLDDFIRILRVLSTTSVPERREAIVLLNGLAFCRTANALSLACGLDPIVAPGLTAASLDLLEEYWGKCDFGQMLEGGQSQL